MKLQNLLILVGIFIIISLLTYSYRKTIPLLFVKFIYGFYSKEFVKMYKRIYSNNPFPHAAKSELIEYIGILRAEKKIPHCKTSIEIKYLGHKLGERVKKLERIEGQPEYFSIREIGNLSVKIYGYDISIYGLNALALYFVLDGTFFLGEIIIKKAFQNFKPETVIQPLSIDYCTEMRRSDEVKIVDSMENKLLILDDGFSMHLKYFNMKNNDALSKLFAEQESINNRFSLRSEVSSNPK